MKKLLARTMVLIAFGAVALTVVPSSRAALEVHAHRGGANAEGVAAFPENSMSAFENSLKEGWVIEFDLQVTSDGVPVVMHDDDLDRTTTCTGMVDETTIDQLSACRIDQLGSGDARQPLPADDPRLEPVPTFDQVLELLKRTGGKANIETKDLAGDHPEFVSGVYGSLQASGIPSSRIIVQNFKPSDLPPAKTIYPGVATSLLSLLFLNDSFAIQTAVEQGIDWVSPQWPISASFMERARAAGKRVVPFTVDDEQGMLEADALGVDALITNDPAMADRLVGLRPSLTLKVNGAKKVRPGKRLKLRATITNAGLAPSDAASLRLDPGRSRLRVIGGRAKSVARLAAGESRTVTFPLLAGKRRVKPGRVQVRLRLDQEGLAPVSKTIRVRVLKPRRRAR